MCCSNCYYYRIALCGYSEKVTDCGDLAEYTCSRVKIKCGGIVAGLHSVVVSSCSFVVW